VNDVLLVQVSETDGSVGKQLGQAQRERPVLAPLYPGLLLVSID
jgi:hypothetical protein